MSKKNVKYPEIKKSICEREHTSRSTYRAAIRDSKGMDRWQAWVDKRDYGDETRLLLLAYGMVRGLPYRAIEPKCGEFNTPSATGISTLAMHHGMKIEPEAVKSWLAGAAAPEKVERPAPVVEEAPSIVPAKVPNKPGFFARLLGKTA